jgi:hypothetical protein
LLKRTLPPIGWHLALAEQALDAERTEGVLDPADILVDWTEKERQALLRRALFDPATYGRVRFHHRSVQEYLAARRLLTLREKQGMPAKRLCRLLFTELYGERLVIPSMQAIAAWLALWDDDVRRELMEREPETLLSMGDPESLPIIFVYCGFFVTHSKPIVRHHYVRSCRVRH